MKFGLTFVGVLLFAVSTSHRARSDLFVDLYDRPLAPKGHGEFEQWITTRWEKEHGSYSVVDFREEFEYGVTDNFQLAIYLNHHYVHANDDVPAEDPARPGNRLPGAYETGGEDVATPDTIRRRRSDSYHFESVSLEGIYRLLSPYKDPILSAFAVLTITGYGLYYAGGERLRAWTSWIHLAVGLALPILLLIHIFLGRRTRPSGQSRTRSRLASQGEADRHPKPMTTSPNTALSEGSNSAEFQVAHRRVL